jgi:MFS family permease
MPFKIASLPALTALRLMLPFGFGFFLSMFTRAVSNMVKQPIQLELGLNEEAISLALGASFFITFALAQLPVGLMLDRYDPRKVNGGLFLVAAAGAVLMALSTDVASLSLGRILMGIGFASAMMGALKTYALWFPKERLPTINSLQFMVGLLGAWSATKPTELLLRVFDWRELYLLFAGLTVLAALLIVVVTPKHRGSGQGETFMEQLRGMASVYADGYFWRIAPWMFVSMGVTQGLSTLYVFSWFTDVALFSVSQGATAVSFVTLASAINFSVMGTVSERMSARGHGPMFVPIIGQSMAMILLALLATQILVAVVPQWVVWILFAGTATLAFAALSQAFPAHMMGRVYAAFNLLGFMTTAGAQWLVGRVLDMYPHSDSGAAAPEAYQLAFILLLACQATAAAWFVLASRLGIGSRSYLQKNGG